MVLEQLKHSQLKKLLSAITDSLTRPLSRACAGIFDSPCDKDADVTPPWFSEEKAVTPVTCRIKRF